MIGNAFRLTSERILGATFSALILSLLALPVLGAAQSDRKDPSLAKLRSMAASQHEIAVILITKQEYEKAAEEIAKIFQLKWPEDQEPVLLKELMFFSDQFLHKNQPGLGLQLLEGNAGAFKTTASRVAIWKEKGYLYKEIGQMDKALECFREAQRLEKSSP